MKHIYLSPHSDDVALSCGGQIIAGGASGVLVLNVFTSDGNEATNTKSAFAGSISSNRTSEDKASWASLGVAAHHTNLPEALLRGVWPFVLLQRSTADGIRQQLYNVLLPLVAAHPGAAFHFPAAIGNHVDHVVCRDVALRLLDEGQLDKISLYEDIPYCWLKFLRGQYYRLLVRDVDLDSESRWQAFRRDGDSLLEYLVRNNVPFPKGRKLFSAVYFANVMRKNRLRLKDGNKRYNGRIAVTRLNESVIAKKIQLIHHYRSQIPMLFGKMPEDTLQCHTDSLLREVTIEIERATSAQVQ